MPLLCVGVWVLEIRAEKGERIVKIPYVEISQKSDTFSDDSEKVPSETFG
jgi:hypothetical protein